MMNKKIAILILVVTLGLVAAIGYYLLFFKPDKAGNTVADNTFGWKFPVVKFPITGPGDLAYSDIRDPGGIPQGLPVRLKIPVIGVDSAIEDALITPDGRMDVPAGSKNVAWFALGPPPGQVGSAVIGGHYGVNHNIPFVFYKLDKLNVGDKIYIEDDKGDTLAFMVRSIKLFDRNADATTVFTSDDGLAHLNLITCEGIWNRVNGNYPERRVVFADAINPEAVAPFSTTTGGGTNKAQDIAAFPRTFGVGATGSDVVVLQTFLQEKGFLAIPPGVSKGRFGSLTRVAVANYQTSAGLSPVGYFGPKTRAKILAEMGGDTGLPNAGPDGTGLPSDQNESVSLVEIIIGFVKSLYATWQDGLITTLLLVLIIFVVVKIIKHVVL